MMVDVASPARRRVTKAGGAAGTPDFDALRNEDFLSYKISVLSRIMDRGVDRRTLPDVGLPLTALRILGYLDAYQEGRILRIAREMHMLGSQVSKSMMELVENGYVARSPDPSDRRGAIFRLTPKGRTVFDPIFARALRKQREVAGLIGARNYRIVADCLDILIAHYGAADQAEEPAAK
jgi:DNA-binding MarR family transcriptional regulator